MKIPKKITIMGRTFEVQISDKLRQEDNANGQAWLDEGIIKIDKYVKGDKRDQSFLHEINHIKTHMLGYEDLNDNEQFIDSMSNLDLQVIQQLLKANGVK